MKGSVNQVEIRTVCASNIRKGQRQALQQRLGTQIQDQVPALGCQPAARCHTHRQSAPRAAAAAAAPSHPLLPLQPMYSTPIVTMHSFHCMPLTLLIMPHSSARSSRQLSCGHDVMTDAEAHAATTPLHREASRQITAAACLWRRRQGAEAAAARRSAHRWWSVPAAQQQPAPLLPLALQLLLAAAAAAAPPPTRLLLVLPLMVAVLVQQLRQSHWLAAVVAVLLRAASAASCCMPARC